MKSWRLLFIVFCCAIGFAAIAAEDDETGEIADSPKRGSMFIGLLKGVALTKLSESPVGLADHAQVPPLGTLVFGYEASGYRFEQFALEGGLTIADELGVILYMQPGILFTWPRAQLLVGIEFWGNLEGGVYDGSYLDHWGYGAFAKGMTDYSNLRPSLELRLRQVLEADLEAREGTTTRIAHDMDILIRPALEIDFANTTLLMMYTYYQPGITSIASRDFAIGLASESFSIFSLGIGYDFGSFDIWVKGHGIAGIKDEMAYAYQAPLVYPDFLLAKESLFLQGRWRF